MVAPVDFAVISIPIFVIDVMSGDPYVKRDPTLTLFIFSPTVVRELNVAYK